MASNRVDDDYWNLSINKGFSFTDDNDGVEEDEKFFGISKENATQLRQELKEDVSSLSSFTSEASNDELPDGMRIKNLPTFLWSDENSIENELEKISIDRSYSSSRHHDPFAGGPSTWLKTSFLENQKQLSIEDAVRGLLIGAEVSLEHFKSLDKKKALLAKAIEINDGNAILAVILFLSKTLKPGLFRHILIENKKAANAYLRHIEIKNEISHVTDLLSMLGRSDEALVVRYKQILRSENNFPKFQRELKHFHEAECALSDDHVSQVVREHLQLLDTHRSLIEKDSTFPHTKYQSVLKTLEYLSEHHYESSATTLSNIAFKGTFNLSTKQYGWVCLQALTRAKKWPQIESLLLTKSWLPSSTAKCVLPVEDVCHVLKDAPEDSVATFLRLVDDPHKRVGIAKKLKCHKVVFETYTALKDRSALLSYRSNLQDGSKEAVQIDNQLKDKVSEAERSTL